MNWKQLVNTLDRLVPAGSVTTYAEVSQRGYGKPSLNQPVHSLLLGAILYVAGAIGMVLVARHSDVTGERRWHVAVAAFVAAVGLVLTGVTESTVVEIVALCIASLGIYGALATLWSLPTAFLSGTAAAAGIALINPVGNLGGFVGPYAVGALSDATGSFYAGLLLLAASVFVAGLLALVVRHDRGLEEATAAAGAALEG